MRVNNIRSGLATGEMQAPLLVIVPPDRIVTLDPELESFALHQTSVLEAGSGLQMEQLSGDSGGVTVLENNPGHGDLQERALAHVHVYGVCFLVLAEEDVDGRLV